MIGFLFEQAAHRARIAAHIGLLHVVAGVLSVGARFSAGLAWAEACERVAIDNAIAQLRAQRHQGL